MFLAIGFVVLVYSFSSIPQVQARGENSLQHQDRKITGMFIRFKSDVDAMLFQYESTFLAQEISASLTDSSDNVQTARRKRNINILLAGKRFLDFVLKGANKVPTDTIKRRKFEKRGGIDQMKEDFDRYSPSGVRRFALPNGGQGKAGTIGDRVVIMKTKGEKGKPSLKVFKAIDIRNSEATRKSLAEVDAYEITYID